MPHVTSPHRLSTQRSGLLVIDLQEKLVPAIPSGENVVRETVRLANAAAILGVPAAATVQYPKGLGGLVSPLDELFPEPAEKLDFSAAVCRDSLDQWALDGRDQIVVVGIETHICILQSVLDLIAEGHQVFVVAEAIASQHGHDHEAAVEQMVSAGASLTTVQAVLFQWLGSASHPHFKAISKLVKDHH